MLALATARHTASSWDRLQDLATLLNAWVDEDRTPLLAVTLDGHPALLHLTACIFGQGVVQLVGTVGDLDAGLDVTDPDTLQAAIGPHVRLMDEQP